MLDLGCGSLVLVVAVLIVVAVIWDCRRAGYSDSETAGWAVLALVFGVLGGGAYLVVRAWRSGRPAPGPGARVASSSHTLPWRLLLYAIAIPVGVAMLLVIAALAGERRAEPPVPSSPTVTITHDAVGRYQEARARVLEADRRERRRIAYERRLEQDRLARQRYREDELLAEAAARAGALELARMEAATAAAREQAPSGGRRTPHARAPARPNDVRSWYRHWSEVHERVLAAQRALEESSRFVGMVRATDETAALVAAVAALDRAARAPDEAAARCVVPVLSAWQRAAEGASRGGVAGGLQYAQQASAAREAAATLEAHVRRIAPE